MAYSSITKPGLHFNPKAYTGNAGTQSITGIGFRPDLTWIKRLNTTGGNMWTDVVRGVTKTIISNETGAEQTFTNGLTSFDSDGFSLGSEGGFNSSNTFTSFSWKAANAQGSSNTDGTINSTYTSANTTAGFSIVQYTGTGSNATVGHGLGVAPKTVVIKKTSGTGQWPFGHTGIGFTKFLELNLTGAAQTNSNRFNNTAPTSTVFSIGTEGDVNTNGQTYIAYCFAEKKGFSKFGVYKGNGNANGSFIFLGFKPAFIMVKSTTSTTEWHVSDSSRRPANPNNSYISASSSAAENTGNPTDFLSNGVKIRTSNAGWNQSGQTFIYWAFAEEPLVANVGASGIPATAK